MASTEYIEIKDNNGLTHTFVAGTRFRVARIVQLHIHGDFSVDWIVENYEALNHAKVYAALAYYYDNKEQIDREWEERLDEEEKWAEEANPMTLDKFKEKNTATPNKPARE